MDRLEAMSLLAAAVEAGSLSAASRHLGTPLPTISRKIAELEAHLHTQLLIRSHRQLTLTSAGVAYLAACKRILDEVNDAERAAAGEYSAPKGDLVITAPIVFGRLHVLPVIVEFLATYPEIDIKLVQSDRNAHLLDDHLDLAVRIGELPDSSLRATRIGAVRRVVCGSPDYFAKHRTPKSPADLSKLDCVTFDSLMSATAWSFTKANARGEDRVPIRSRLVVNTAEAAIDAARAGLGVTRVLSYQVAHAVAAGELKIVLAKFEAQPLPIHIIHAGQGPLPRKLQVFLDFAVQRLRSRCGQQTK